MVKAKDGSKKIVGSFKTVKEAAEFMVNSNKAANVTAALWNINSALLKSEGRTKKSKSHPIKGQPRKTAYGLTWYTTKR